MEKRALIALGLSFLVFMLFIYFGDKMKMPGTPSAPAPQTAAKPEKPAPVPVPAPAAAPAAVRPAAPQGALPTPARPAKEVVVETPLFRAVFTEVGARLQSFQLKKYRESMPFTTIYHFALGPVAFDVERYQDPAKAGAKPKELIRAGKNPELPLALSWEGKNLAVPAVLSYGASPARLNLKAGETGNLTFTGVSAEGVKFSKTMTFKADRYSFDMAVKVANHSGHHLEGHLDLGLSEDFTGDEVDKSHFYGFNGSINNSREEIKSGGLKEMKTFAGKVDWAGLDEGYFLTAMIPGNPKALVTLQEKALGSMTATLRTPVEALPPGQETQVSYVLYFGPKDLVDLKPLGLDRAVDFGWFDVVGRPFLYALKYIERYSYNYGWAIIIMTILLRVLFFYPNHKSYKSMKDMQKLQPRVAEIRAKHKDDKEAMNKELMALYRTFKVNPLAGCLPMVIQLPVFIALYNVLGYAIELRHASFIPTVPFTNIVWLADLSSKDPLLITPIVMGATMFIQQKMTPSPGDPAQAKMMMFLPLVFTFLFLNFASGLVIYWLVNNVLSIVQQHYTNKYLT